jgi:phage terminase large subunit-like protein
MLGLSPPISHSRSFDHRLFARLLLTAIASAFRCPTSTTTYANQANLAGAFLAQIVKKYEGTRLSRFLANRRGTII